ncbi:hypothetical protein B0T21DRAFT_388263 [Apiosordaria backusii]|uniref:Uncharacterized protein n=1 Tax=Apiosordaria backusii TaxID=314023 RepID=A0AA40DFP5_9PEZI|nr:hypothetical protein B0T21DRAFT_388263 [Apiosordaria backusii]
MSRGDFTHNSPRPPFTTDILSQEQLNPSYTSPHHPQQSPQSREAALLDQFPASFLTNNNLTAPQPLPTLNHIEQDLNPHRLHSITPFLHLAGRPVPPRPLHYQLLLNRTIVLSERINVHLVWGQNRIFLKPLPRYLLNPLFWTSHLACNCTTTTTTTTTTQQQHEIAPTSQPTPPPPCQHHRISRCALGLLLHYASLIPHESDFTIAQEKHLLPPEITWPKWRLFVRELLQDGGSDELLYGSDRVAERFIYGELRLNRLNLINWVLHGLHSRGMLTPWDSYGKFFRDHVTLMIGITAWVLLPILSAMEVGLGTTILNENAMFQAASYGFTMFSILGLVGAVVIMGVVFVTVLVWNWVRTLRFEAARARSLGRTWR